MEKVKSLNEYVGNGVTEPIWAILEDSGISVLKYETNLQGKKILFNELVSYLIAKKVDITMPSSGVCRITSETLYEKENLKLKQVYDDNKNRCCFFSKAVPKATRLNCGIIRDIENKDNFEKILLLDHIIYNKDRNQGNILVNLNKDQKKMYIIDHTHVFKNETIWDKYCFEQGMKAKDYMDNDIFIANKYYYNMFFNGKDITQQSLLREAMLFKQKINEETLEEIFSSVPKEWLVDFDDLKALKRYLLYRLEHVEDIINVILSNK